jgi:glycosyltransferase involved in cell wall biosynthesis
VQEVTIIIPTLALAEREASLYGALESVLGQEKVRATPVVSINGTGRDPRLLARLRADPRIRVVEQDETGIPGALRAGREVVETAWFGTLDDDDFLLPGALLTRVRALTEHPECDTVVTNGYRRDATGDVMHVTDPDRVRRDPLGHLLETNWLLPGSWLSRASALGPQVFAEMPRFLECTYLAIRIALTRRLLFLDEPTVVWHAGRPGSQSWSRPHRLGQADALRPILDLPLPAAFRAGILRKFTEACHAVADLHLQERDLGEAWRWHLRSLRGSGGWRYLFYTRRLLAALAGKGAL